MAFSPEALKTARDAGYKDEEIYSHLAASDPRFDAARKAGYQLDEVASHFAATQLANTGAPVAQLATAPANGVPVATPPAGAEPVGGSAIVAPADFWNQSPAAASDLSQFLTKADPTMGGYAGAAAIGESTALENPAIKSGEDFQKAYTDSLIAGALPRPEGDAWAGVRRAEDVIEGLVSPLNIALAGTVAGLPSVLQKVAGAGFTAQMTKSASGKVPEIGTALAEGDYTKAGELLVEAGGEGLMTAAGGAHMTARARIAPLTAEAAKLPADVLTESVKTPDVTTPEAASQATSPEASKVQAERAAEPLPQTSQASPVASAKNIDETGRAVKDTAMPEENRAAPESAGQPSPSGQEARAKIAKEWKGSGSMEGAKPGDDYNGWVEAKQEIMHSIAVPEGWAREDESYHTKWGTAYIYLRNLRTEETVKVRVGDHPSSRERAAENTYSYQIPKKATLEHWAKVANEIESDLADLVDEKATAAPGEESGGAGFKAKPESKPEGNLPSLARESTQPPSSQNVNPESRAPSGGAQGPRASEQPARDLSKPEQTTSGAELGPGAANFEEPLASYEARRFGERFVEDETIDPKIRDATGNRYYDVLPNRVTAAEAANLIESRGIDASEAAVRDTKNELSHAVRSTVGQVLIKKLNEQYRATKETNPVEAEKILNRTADLAEWQMEYGTRLGQGVQSFAMWSRLSPEGFLRTFERMAERAKVKAKKTGGKPPQEMTPEITKEITRLAGEIEAAPEGIPRTDATLRLSKYMAKQLGYDPWNLPIGIYYSHILSGYNTHIVNALDTGLNVLSEIGTMALDRPAHAADILRAAVRGIGEGKSDALVTLSEGRRVGDGKYAEEPGLFEGSTFGEKGGVPISEQTRTGRVFKKIAESKPAKFLNAYKYVGRLMAASDTVFYRAAEEARSAMLALREAEASGAEKSKLRETANHLLGFDRIEEFRSKAREEGYKGAKLEARATELMMQSRPEGLRNAASEYAGLATYNHAPEGALGYVATQVGQMAQRLPVLKLVVPFTRIVANVTNRGLDWTPYGYKRALAGRTFGDGPMFGEARRAELTKATAGTIGLAGLAVLNQLGAIQVHGGGPSNADRKKQLQSAGWKPFTIQIGDTYISYAPTPLGLGLSSLGNYLDANRYQELKQKDLTTRTMYAVSRIPSTVFNQSFLSGLSGAFKALSSSSPGEQISELKKLFSRTTSALTTPNLLRDLNRIYDPSYRDSNSIAEDLIRDIPVIRLSLRPSLNAYGEPAQQPGNRFVSIRKTEPEWRIVVDKNLRIPVADDTTFIEPKAGYEYQRIAGQRMKQWMSGHLSSLRTMTDDQAQESITRASADIFSSVRGQIRSTYPNSLRKRK